MSSLKMQSRYYSSSVINDVETELVIQQYMDRILVLVTQLGKVGILVTSNKIFKFVRRLISTSDSGFITFDYPT